MFEVSSSAIEFERRARRFSELQLTSLIDVVFILIVFFMLTTTFARVESMELLLPSTNNAAAAKTSDKKDLVRIFMSNGGSLLFGERAVTPEELQTTLKALFTENPASRIMVLTDDEVSMQELVAVMDMVYLSGGKTLFVKEWQRKGQGE